MINDGKNTNTIPSVVPISTQSALISTVYYMPNSKCNIASSDNIEVQGPQKDRIPAYINTSITAYKTAGMSSMMCRSVAFIRSSKKGCKQRGELPSVGSTDDLGGALKI